MYAQADADARVPKGAAASDSRWCETSSKNTAAVFSAVERGLGSGKRIHRAPARVMGTHRARCRRPPAEAEAHAWSQLHAARARLCVRFRTDGLVRRRTLGSLVDCRSAYPSPSVENVRMNFPFQEREHPSPPPAPRRARPFSYVSAAFAARPRSPTTNLQTAQQAIANAERVEAATLARRRAR